ncbi:cytochrome P460 family protein [Humisphaera borealis]|uniref:Cytochrome P460 family protein n=1 Tax=Humisphaera borealis TaxID=2807512 RepID=A0A7M2WZN0_9BACT|nr:cytochrome P460 family protein [Humisphaera borealis]QOV90936.1 cytochrome P460 family protein [Humisphaera borealis]
MTKRIICAAIASSLLLGCASKPQSPSAAKTAGSSVAATAPSAVTASELLTTYPKLRLLTPEPVYVNLELARLCRGANEADLRSARKTAGPHAHSTIRIYMNALAADAFPRSKNAYPVGSVIVKEKSPLWYTDASDKQITLPAGVGGMIKRAPGYDPKYGDWEYFYAEENAKTEVGRIDSCRDCHSGASSRDYVFGQWASPAAGE